MLFRSCLLLRCLFAAMFQRFLSIDPVDWGGGSGVSTSLSDSSCVKGHRGHGNSSGPSDSSAPCSKCLSSCAKPWTHTGRIIPGKNSPNH